MDPREYDRKFWGKVPPAERTLWGRWLRRERGDRAQKDVVAELEARLRRPLAINTYSEMEGRDGVNEDWRDVFRRFYGKPDGWEPTPDEWSPKPETSAAPASDLSALASVVERQQSQIADLIGVVTQQQGQIAELLEAVRLLTRPAALVALSDTLASTLQDDESAALAHGRLGAVPAAEAPRPTVLPDAERRGEAP